MIEYHKIQSIFKRDMTSPKKTLMIGKWTLPEFEYLACNQWVFTEKVDGINIRIMFFVGKIFFGGRTVNTHLPSPLVTRLNERFDVSTQRVMAETFSHDAVLYGEGYGAKIQKGGGNYRPDQDFVLFDVLVGGWWLQRADVEAVAKVLGLDVVPIIGEGTLHDAVALAKEGIVSTWGDFPAEGIVARPKTELKTRDGRRIITKIKSRDF